MEETKINEEVAKIKSQTEDLIQQDNINELIKDNMIEFKFANTGTLYRVRKPTFEQKARANQERMKKFVSMLKDPSFLLESDLIKVYETRGISIKELDDRFGVLRHKKDDYALKLGQAINDKKTKEELEVFRREIEDILTEQNEIILRKSVLLDSSIESQINVFIYTYLGFLVAERQTSDGIWVKAWETYEDFLKEEEDLVNQIVWYASLICRNEIKGM